MHNDSMRMSFELYDAAGRRQLQAREYLIGSINGVMPRIKLPT